MALLVGTGFVAALAAAAATVYSIVGSQRGAARQLQRRLAPSQDLPDLVEHHGRAAQVFAQGLAPIARLATPDEDELSRVRERLVQAGLRSPHAVPIYLAVKVLLPMLLVGVLLWFSSGQAETVDYLSAWAVAVAGGYAYVATQSAGLRVLNVSDPANPWQVGSLEGPGGTAPGPVRGSARGWSPARVP
jgi:hypothetical protein